MNEKEPIVFGHGEVCVANAYDETDNLKVPKEVIIYKPNEKRSVGTYDGNAKGKSSDEINTLVRIRIDSVLGGMELLFKLVQAIEACRREEQGEYKIVDEKKEQV
jgi:hypothetical protein